MSPIPNTNEIKMYCHCRACGGDRPEDQSPQEWARLDVGFTKLGIQIWCWRCEKNVMHIDFQGMKHPANTHVAEVKS